LWLGGIILVASLTIGLKAYILVQLPIIAIASSVGVFLFMYSTNMRMYIGNDTNNGIMQKPRYTAVPSSRCLAFCSGSLATLVSITSTTSARIPTHRFEACHNDNPCSRKPN
jgi:hypothetical protein